jgi:hypothetical protein
MRLITGALAIVVLVAAHAAAQQPELGVWFGILSSPTGASTDDRFEIQVTANGTVMVWAPFGKTPVNWGSLTSREDGSIEFHWAGNPQVLCALRRNDQLYEGTCQRSGHIERRVTLTRNAPPYGLELPVSDTDFRILAKTRQILSGPSVWNRHDDRRCEEDAKQNSWSLFCALYQASVAVAGKFLPGRPVMMSARAIVGELANGKSFQHPLMDYNNLESTAYTDIAMIFDRAKKRLEVSKTCAESDSSKWSVDERYTSPFPKDAVPMAVGGVTYTSERFGYTAHGKTYRLNEILGPTNASTMLWDDWLAESTAVTRRTWKRGDFGGLDVKGELGNGNHWRYFSQCGESLAYYDAPADAAAFFDRLIEGVYFRHGHR